jgi:hypothetical protein
MLVQGVFVETSTRPPEVLTWSSEESTIPPQGIEGYRGEQHEAQSGDNNCPAEPHEYIRHQPP